jgi:hypothetical protein
MSKLRGGPFNNGLINPPLPMSNDPMRQAEYGAMIVDEMGVFQWYVWDGMEWVYREGIRAESIALAYQIADEIKTKDFEYPELNEEGDSLKPLPCCPICRIGDLVMPHQDKVTCLTCGWEAESEKKVYASCLKCKEEVTCIPDLDNPLIYHMKCSNCGNEAELSIPPEHA